MEAFPTEDRGKDVRDFDLRRDSLPAYAHSAYTVTLRKTHLPSKFLSRTSRSHEEVYCRSSIPSTILLAWRYPCYWRADFCFNSWSTWERRRRTTAWLGRPPPRCSTATMAALAKFPSRSRKGICVSLLPSRRFWQYRSSRNPCFLRRKQRRHRMCSLLETREPQGRSKYGFAPRSVQSSANQCSQHSSSRALWCCTSYTSCL